MDATDNTTETAWFSTSWSGTGDRPAPKAKAHTTEACAAKAAKTSFNRMADWCKEGKTPETPFQHDARWHDFCKKCS